MVHQKRQPCVILPQAVATQVIICDSRLEEVLAGETGDFTGMTGLKIDLQK
jgi:hypothetical protein